MHNVAHAAVRELLFGGGFGALAFASHMPESPAFDMLVIGGVMLVVSGSVLGVGGEQPGGVR